MKLYLITYILTLTLSSEINFNEHLNIDYKLIKRFDVIEQISLTSFIESETTNNHFGYQYELILTNLTSKSTIEIYLKEKYRTLITNQENFIILYEGIVKGRASTVVEGTIVGNTFHGTILWENGNVYTLEHAKSMKIDCQSCETIGYWKEDIEFSQFNQLKMASINYTQPHFENHDSASSNHSNNNKFHRTSRSIKSGFCGIVVIVHSTFVQLFKSEIEATSAAVRRIQMACGLLNPNFRSNPDVNFVVSQISVANPSDPLLNGNLDNPDNILKRINSKRWGPCLTIVIYSVSWGSILGVANVGTKGGPGMCGYASAIILTSSLLGNPMPIPMFNIVAAHELGHILGSFHDPAPSCTSCEPMSLAFECSPGGLNGNFIMYPSASEGALKNNNLFSSCSARSFHNVNNDETKTSCLTATQQFICGNGVVESGEDCDTGPYLSSCCNPPGSQNQCKFTFGSQCSPSNGPCCTERCMFKPTSEICSQGGPCTSLSYCNGTSSTCPIVILADNSVCSNGSALCENGICGKSNCPSFGKVPCQLGATCVFACRNITSNVCEAQIVPPYKTSHNPQGSPCYDNNGFCNSNGQCITVRLDSFLVQIWSDLLDGKLFEKLLALIVANIWQSAVAISLYILLTIMLIVTGHYNTKAKENIRK